MHALNNSLEEYLNETSTLEDLLGAIRESVAGLKTHRDEISHLLTGLPDFLVAKERDAWHQHQTELESLLNDAVDSLRSPEAARTLSSTLPEKFERLQLLALSVRDAAWAARGPTTHSGINELIFLLERNWEEPNEVYDEQIRQKLELEFSRMEFQLAHLHEFPGFVALALGELLPELSDMLNELLRIQDFALEDPEPILIQLEEWAQVYSSHDIEFLSKRYSHLPTPLPSVNLALNSQLLYIDELVPEEMVDYFVEMANDTLCQASSSFLMDRQLSEVESHAYRETLQKLTELIASIPDQENHQSLQEHGNSVVNEVQRLLDVQRGAESEAGGRLDIKIE